MSRLKIGLKFCFFTYQHHFLEVSLITRYFLIFMIFKLVFDIQGIKVGGFNKDGVN